MDHPIFQVSDLRIAVFDQEISMTGVPGPYTESGDQLGHGWVEVIPKVSFEVMEGESLALVGESASGKSLTLMGPFGLLSPGARVIGGETRYRDLTYRPGGAVFDPDTKRSRSERKRAGVAGTVVDNLSDDAWAKAIGTEVGFLFQNPIGSWTPVEVIGTQSGEALEYHSDLTPDEINDRVFDALGEVKLPKSKRLFNAFSNELSRGMAQRAMLAAAITKAPRLLIADEPLNGLDAPVAAAIMELILDMRDKRGMAMVIVTHDLAAVARIAERVGVVYGGTIIEHAPTTDIFHRPKHPYTSGLIGSIPGIGTGRLRHIEGEAPRLVETTRSACVFADRCEFVIDVCTTEVPQLERIGATEVACHRATELELPGLKG